MANRSFSFDEYADALAKQIKENLDSNEKPLSIGIFGEWGSGKSELL